MQTIEIKGWVFAKPHDYENKVVFEFSAFDYEAAVARGSNYSDWACYKKVAEHSFTVEVPDDIDATALKIGSLESQRDTLRAEFTRRLNEINDQISKLQAIEYTPAQEVA